MFGEHLTVSFIAADSSPYRSSDRVIAPSTCSLSLMVELACLKLDQNLVGFGIIIQDVQDGGEFDGESACSVEFPPCVSCRVFRLQRG